MGRQNLKEENEGEIKTPSSLTAQQLINETEQEPYTIDELLSKVTRGQK